jgi:hypothetical protein
MNRRSVILRSLVAGAILLPELPLLLPFIVGALLTGLIAREGRR